MLRAGVSATKFRLLEEGHGSPGAGPAHSHSHGDDHGHSHPHDHDAEPSHGHGHAHEGAGSRAHAHRSVAETNRLIEGSSLSATAKARTIELFARLAAAEAAIHRMPIEEVHLHEVGELDSIVDVAGAVFGLEWFGIDRFVASPLNVGGGMVRSAHGVFPVPAPATLGLLTGVPVYSSGVQMETVTPTGALLVAGHATEYGAFPAIAVERVGYGAGDRDLPGSPNVLRVVIGDDGAQGPVERVVVMECEIDDMNPQIFGALMTGSTPPARSSLLHRRADEEEPAGDAAVRGAPPSRREALAETRLRETTTIGLLPGGCAQLPGARR